MDTTAPWISGAVLTLCAFSISAAANPRTGRGWWTLDIFAVVLGIFVLGPISAAILTILATVRGLAAARTRGKYWPVLIPYKFLVWDTVMGILSYLAVLLLMVNADKSHDMKPNTGAPHSGSTARSAKIGAEPLNVSDASAQSRVLPPRVALVSRWKPSPAAIRSFKRWVARRVFPRGGTPGVWWPRGRC